MKLKVGQQYPNQLKTSTYEIIKISPTGLVLTCKNLSDGKILKFRYFEMSGNYVSGISEVLNVTQF